MKLDNGTAYIGLGWLIWLLGFAGLLMQSMVHSSLIGILIASGVTVIGWLTMQTGEIMKNQSILHDRIKDLKDSIGKP